MIDYFSLFWNAYPDGHRSGREQAKKVWQRMRLDDMAETITGDLGNRLSADRSWVAGYIPSPANYLSRKIWQDDIKPATQNNARCGRTLTLEEYRAERAASEIPF